MPYKRRYRSRSRRRYKRRFSRKVRGKRSLKRVISQVLNKKTETKYYDLANENVNVYHNIGYSAVAPVASFEGSDPVFFNPWQEIPAGTGRANRIGEWIQPVGMSLKLWLSMKQDRQGSIRVLICKLPKTFGGGTVTTSNNIPLFQGAQLGNNGCKLVRPIDKDLGIRTYYDKIIPMTKLNALNKEQHKTLRIWLKRKNARRIIYNTDGNIVNSPISLYVIPYDSYGTLITDNIASYNFYCRMYYKDV